MNLDFDDNMVIPCSSAWRGRTYTTGTIIVHGPPRKTQLRIEVSSWEPSGRTVDTELIDITDEVSRDPLEQLRLGAIMFELWCIKKGVSSETQNQ